MFGFLHTEIKWERRRMFGFLPIYIYIYGQKKRKPLHSSSSCLLHRVHLQALTQRNMKRSFLLSFNFVIVFLLVHGSFSFNNLHHYCDEAAKSNPNLSCDFCIASLEAISKSKNASLEELVEISTVLAMSKATNISCYISQLLKAQNLDKYYTSALQDCLELYADANSTLHESMCDLKSKDYSKANIDASAAMDSSSTCEDGFREREGVVSPLTKETNTFFQLTAIMLAFINMLSRS